MSVRRLGVEEAGRRLSGVKFKIHSLGQEECRDTPRHFLQYGRIQPNPSGALLVFKVNAMSKRKREDGAAQNTDPRERGDAKRRKKERRAASNGQDHSTHEASTPDHLGSPGRSDGKGVERTSTKRERRKAKREERHEEEAQNIKIRRKEHKKNRKDSRRYREPQWSVSVPVGGQMLALDPLFSPDEELDLSPYDNSTLLTSHLDIYL